MTSVAAGAPVVLAHAGGIPEALSVIVPLAVLAAIVIAGRRRQPPDDDVPPDEQAQSPR